jgi:hypothetical protein
MIARVPDRSKRSIFASYFRYLCPHTIVNEIIMSPDFGPGNAAAH